MTYLGRIGAGAVLCALLTGCLVPFDFDGDGKADVAYYLEDGTWWVVGEDEPIWTSTDDNLQAVTGDYDGDGQMAPAALTADGRWETGDAGIITFDPRDETDTPHEHWVPVPGNYDDDRATEPAWFDELNALWFIQGQDDPIQFGDADPPHEDFGDVPVPADYDGDSVDDLAVYRPYDRSFYVQGQGKLATLVLGFPVPADYDGDGDDDPAVYRTATDENVPGDVDALHIAGQPPMPWPEERGVFAAPANYTGAPGDEFATVELGSDGPPLNFWIEGEDAVMVPEDSRPAAMRPWYVQSILRLTFAMDCDLSGDCPWIGVPYDFDGSGQADLAAVDEEGAWFRAGEPEPFFVSADPDDYQHLVPGDYDGDGTWEAANLLSGGRWETAGTRGTVLFDPLVDGDDFGEKGIPVPGNYDGDSATEMAWFSPFDAMWHIEGQDPIQFGVGCATESVAFDSPVPADYDGDGRDDLAIYRPADGTFHVQGVGAIASLIPAGFPTAADYDGDGDDEPAVVGLVPLDQSDPDPQQWTWTYEFHAVGQDPVVWNGIADFPTPADYTPAAGDELAAWKMDDWPSGSLVIEGESPTAITGEPTTLRPSLRAEILRLTYLQFVLLFEETSGDPLCD